MNDKSALSLAPSVLADEDAAVAYFTAIRWKDGPRCPYCGGGRVYHFADGRSHRCADCRRKFTIRAGTIFEDSRLSMRQWLQAIHCVTTSSIPVTSTKLARTLDVTQKTAWLVLQRLRLAAASNSFNGRSTLPQNSSEELLL